MAHSVTYRVYYEDTDAGGIMYHGNFINFCERGRTEFINSKGLTNQSLLDDDVGIVVAHLSADYKAPAFLEDMLEVRTAVKEVKNSSFILRHSIAKDGQEIFVMDVVLVCVNKRGRPIPIPPHVKKVMIT